MPEQQPHRSPAIMTDVFPNERPGVPKEQTPHPAPGSHWAAPERQPPSAEVLIHAGRKELTPVFGTALPPHGLSGWIRRAAYRIPEHRSRHWMLLLLADRIDVLEHRLGRPGVLITSAAALLAIGAAYRIRSHRR